MGKLKTAIHILSQNPIKLIPALGENGHLKFIPDALYLKWMFQAEMGYALNLDNPVTFNEKLQWLKLHDRKPLYTRLADKVAVRSYINQTIGAQHLIPIIGKWYSAEEIDFDKLPNQFVLKCNHDSNSVMICRDKTSFDIEKARSKIKKRLRRNAFYGGREWPYKNITPCVIAEKYMTDDRQSSLTDYKFFCFNGEAEFLYVSTGLENHETASISFFDPEWRRLPFSRKDYQEYSGDLPKPKHFEEMKQIANDLAHRINAAFVRVDLYEICNQIYFSEFTFTPCCGMLPFSPTEWDEKIGALLRLPI